MVNTKSLLDVYIWLIMVLFEVLSATKGQPGPKDNFEEFMRLQKMYNDVILKNFADMDSYENVSASGVPKIYESVIEKGKQKIRPPEGKVKVLLEDLPEDLESEYYCYLSKTIRFEDYSPTDIQKDISGGKVQASVLQSIFTESYFYRSVFPEMPTIISFINFMNGPMTCLISTTDRKRKIKELIDENEGDPNWSIFQSWVNKFFDSWNRIEFEEISLGCKRTGKKPFDMDSEIGRLLPETIPKGDLIGMEFPALLSSVVDKHNQCISEFAKKYKSQASETLGDLSGIKKEGTTEDLFEGSSNNNHWHFCKSIVWHS